MDVLVEHSVFYLAGTVSRAYFRICECCGEQIRPIVRFAYVLDESYTRLWSATDVPDFDKLPWTSSMSYLWHTG